MGNPATLFRFRLDVSDVDRGFYEAIDLRAAMHPSETEIYLLTRVLAYALNYEEGLTFAPGLCTGDEPAISLPGEHGAIAKWIDIGNPSPRRMHKAAKAARSVRIYTYKDPEALKREALGEHIHRAAEIEIFALEERFLKQLAAKLARDNTWSVIFNDGGLVVTIGDESFMGAVTEHRLG